MPRNILRESEIKAQQGVEKIHFLNPNARRINKSLGDLCGLQNIGFHLIEIEPGCDSTEYHKHYHEEECVYILAGEALATIGDQITEVKAGDFIAYPAGGEAHKLHNHGSSTSRCIVVGQRLAHDVTDYPAQNKRLFRQQGLAWNLVDIDSISEPNAGKK